MNKISKITLIASFIVLTSLFLSSDSTVGLPASIEETMDDAVAKNIDTARFEKVRLLEEMVDFPSTGPDVEKKLTDLVDKYPSEPEYFIALASAQVDNSKFAEAAATMEKMAATHPDKAAGLEKLSSFYAERVKPEKQLETLRKLADLKKGEDKVAVLNKILAVNDAHLLNAVSKETILREIIQIQPGEFAPVKNLIGQLIEDEKYQEALKETEAAAIKFPRKNNFVLAQKGEILWKMGQGEAALALYDVEMDIASDLPVIRSYLSLLDKIGTRTPVTRDLQRKHRLNTLSRKEFQKYFLIMRNQRDSEKAWKAAEQFINNNKSLTFDDQYLLAQALKANGTFRVAWQLLYGAYLKAPEGSKEDVNALLVAWSEQLSNNPANLASRGSNMLFSKRHFDVSPGISGGLLSLLFNKQDLSWRFSDLAKTSAAFEDAKTHHTLFRNFIKAYPESEHLPNLYVGVIRVLNSYRRPQEALTYATSFMNNYADNKSYYSVAEAALESMRQLNQKDSIEKLYKELLARADARKESTNYNNYLSKLEQFYTKANQLPKVVALYWQQITAHPDDEELYARFTRFLTRYRVHNEELKVYKQAAARFKSNSYYDKIARWYIRQNQKENFKELTSKIADIFSGSELQEYLRDHLRTASYNSGAMHPDTVFYRTMYEYANKRFPRNLDFVGRLLNHYNNYKLWEKYDKLAKRYFYASPQIRVSLLRFLSENNKMDASIASVAGGGDLSRSILLKAIEKKAPQNLAEALVAKYSKDETEKVPELNENASPAEKLFLAEAASWNSYYEASTPVFVSLMNDYPQMLDVSEKVASLYRSLDKRQESKNVYQQLSARIPTSNKYPTLAGEVAMEGGNFAEAFASWKRIISSSPANQERYLEVATILWDYYRFKESAEIIEQGRKALNLPGLFGNKLAAVYESDKNYPKAIDEYILTVVRKYDMYYERYSATDRLEYLANRRGMKGRIIARFQALMDADDKNPNYVRAFNDFLVSMEDNDSSQALLKSSINKYRDIAFVNWLADQFRSGGDAESENKCFRQLIALGGENVQNLLALSQFHERQGQLAEADAILEKRIAMTRTDEPEAIGDYISTLEEAAAFSWKHDKFDQAFARYEMAARLKSDYSRSNSLHQLSEKLILRERYDQASTILKELLKADPLSANYFNTLADIYTRQEDYPGLIVLFKERLEVIKTASQLGKEGRVFRMNQLRARLITNLEKLGDFTNALDQYIEMINLEFKDSTYLDNAYLIAANNNLVDRLMNYYLKTAEKSYKDHRWNYILARLYELQNKIPEAGEQWQKAIVNEPQMTDLRDAYARNLTSQKKYKEAVEQYQEIYRLSGKNSNWLKTVASVQATSGDLDSARKTLDQLLAESALNYETYFEVAEYLSDWGDLALALTRMEQGLEVLKKDIYKNHLSQKRLTQYTQAAIRLGKVESVFDALLALNQVYSTEANKKMNSQAWVARSGQNLTFQVFAEDFAKAARNYASESSLKSMDARLNRILDANIVKYDADNDTNGAGASIRWVRDVALEMGFSKLAAKAIDNGLNERFTGYEEYSYSTTDRSYLSFLRQRFNWDDSLSSAKKLFTTLRKEERDQEIYIAHRIIRTFLPGQEKAFLKNNLNLIYHTGSQRDNFALRLVVLLEKANNIKGMESLAASFNSSSLLLTNYFMEKGYTQMALLALENINKGNLWKDSKKLIIGTRNNENEAALNMSHSSAHIMQNQPISGRLGVEPRDAFTSTDFYNFLPHYASYLEKFGKKGEFEKFISGLTENSPRSALQQKLVGDWYAEHGKWDKAQYHYDLALQLTPGQWQVLVACGELELKKGNRKAALQKWQALISENKNGQSYQKWMEVLWKHNFEAEAIAGISHYLINETGVELHWQDRDLLTSFAYLMYENERGEEIVKLAKSLASAKEKPMNYLLPFIQDIVEIPAVRMATLEQILEIQKKNAGEEDGYKVWLEEAISYSSEKAGFDVATLSWCKIYEARGYLENLTYRIGTQTNYRLIKGKALLGQKQLPAALEELKLYVSLENYGKSERANSAYQIMADKGYPDEAREFILTFIKGQLAEGERDVDLYYSYARYLLDKDDEDSLLTATNYLDRMVFNHFDKKVALQKAAELLEKKNLRKRALVYRYKLKDLVPENSINNLNIVCSLAEAGEKAKAAAMMPKILDENSGVELVSAWAEKYAEVVKADPQILDQEIARLKAIVDKTESGEILVFSLLKAKGDTIAALAYADQALKSMTKPDTLALMAGEFLLNDGKVEKALEYGNLSRNIYPTHGNARLIINSLRKMGKAKELLTLAIAKNNWRLGTPDMDRLDDLFGYSGEGKLRFLEELYGISIKLKDLEVAEGIFELCKQQARDLGLELKINKTELNKMKKQAELEKPKFRLTQTIHNRMGEN